MIINEEDTELFCEIRKDKNGLGYYAVRKESPQFVLHGASLQSLGLRMNEMKKMIDRLPQAARCDRG